MSVEVERMQDNLRMIYLKQQRFLQHCAQAIPYISVLPSRHPRQLISDNAQLNTLLHKQQKNAD